jgi:glutaredoxin 2
MMTIFEDYNEWYQDNQGLIEKIFDEGSFLLDRIHDVFKVIQYIDEENTLKNGVEEELIDIFEIGFGYLYDQVSQLKIYLEEYFQYDTKAMNEYASYINYTLYLDDFRETILDKEEMNPNIQAAFDEVQDKIDQLLLERGDVQDELFVEFDTIINSAFANPNKYQTVSEIFALIAEELQL